MGTPAQRLIELAKRLPIEERRRVVSAIEASLNGKKKQPPSRHGATPSYESLIALAGTARADVDDVSGDKYRHLASAYADEP